jgi:ParB-like chromosome segregation protein Spo0J
MMAAAGPCCCTRNAGVFGDKTMGDEVTDIKISTYQLLPEMAPEQFAALKEDIAKRGVLTPIDIDEHGNILDGYNRVGN